MKKRLALIFMTLTTVITAAAAPPLSVLTTIGMLADMADNIGGDCVETTALMGPGIDPHLYRASAGDMRRLQQAEVILYGGLLLEGKLGNVLGKISKRKPTLAVLEQVDASRLLADPVYQNAYDPHLWMDVALWADTAEAVSRYLGELHPDCAAAMRENVALYRGQLLALHGWIKTSLHSVAPEQRVLVTAHDAFAYYGRAYDVEVRGIQGISTASEASIGDIERISQFIIRRQVPAIFVESSVNPRPIEAVQAAVRAGGWQVEIGDPLFSDAMGVAGSREGTYIGMLHANTLTIVHALGGETKPLPPVLMPWWKKWQ